MRIVTSNTDWPEAPRARARRVGINSFGFGGANAHVILESAEEHITPRLGSIQSTMELSDQKVILPFSASNVTSLERRILDLGTIDDKNMSAAELAEVLANHRSKMEVRGFILTQQKSLRDDLVPSKLYRNTETSRNVKPITFVFTGQGAQWPRMGCDLWQRFPVFRETIESLDNVLKSIPDSPVWNLRGSVSTYLRRRYPLLTARPRRFARVLCHKPSTSTRTISTALYCDSNCTCALTRVVANQASIRSRTLLRYVVSHSVYFVNSC